MLSFASVQLCIATFISYYLSTCVLERDSENSKLHEQVRYSTVQVPYGGQLSDGDGLPVGTPYKVKSCPLRGPCDVARSQRFPSVGTISSPPYGGDESVPYKLGLICIVCHSPPNRQYLYRYRTEYGTQRCAVPGNSKQSTKEFLRNSKNSLWNSQFLSPSLT